MKIEILIDLLFVMMEFYKKKKSKFEEFNLVKFQVEFVSPCVEKTNFE
jgi:hypothetical protein